MIMSRQGIKGKAVANNEKDENPSSTLMRI